MKIPLGRRRGEELDDEIQSHVQMAIRDRIERGESPENATANARREFGNPGVVMEVTRDAWGWRWLENILRDLRYGTRVLRQNPGFAAVAILTMALGIGANTAIFSVVYSALLRPLPYSQPERIVTIGETRSQSGLGIRESRTRHILITSIGQTSENFDSLAAYTGNQFMYAGSGKSGNTGRRPGNCNFFRNARGENGTGARLPSRRRRA